MPACAGLSARRRAGQECRLGIHGSRLRQIGRPGGDDRAFTHGYRKLYRHATASASPGLTQTLDPELLAAAGIKYIDDWVYDGQPTVIGSAKGPLVTFPYTVELNDIPMMIGRHHESDYLLKRAIDQFDRLYAEGKHRAKIMALAIHPTSAASRTASSISRRFYDYGGRFEGVLHCNGAQILDWYLSTYEPAVIGGG